MQYQGYNPNQYNYQNQGPYGYYPPPPETNGMAVASMVLGILSLATCALAAIPGLILGIIARKQIRERNENGIGFAVAGIVCSIVSLVVFALLAIVYFLFFFSMLSDATTNPAYFDDNTAHGAVIILRHFSYAMTGTTII